MIRKFLFSVILLVAFLSFSAFSQTKTEMRQKYKVSAAIETYEVRSGITATFFYDINEQADRIIIKSDLTMVKSKDLLPEMPYLLVQDILEEIIPVDKRGKFCGNFEFESGRNILRNAQYENVSIQMDIHNSTTDEPKATVGQVEINFESMSCPKQDVQIERQN